MAANDSTKKLNEKIKSGDILGLYLFTGEEKYGRKLAAKEIRKHFEGSGFDEFNINVFEGGDFAPQTLADYVRTYPVMSDKKLAIVRNSGVFKSPSAELKAVAEDIIKDLPDYITVIFDEDNLDGRSGLVKKIKSGGTFCEFKFKTQGELAVWCRKTAAEAGIEISEENASHLVFVCDEGMENLKNETEKLVAYCREKGRIEKSDIDKTVRKSLKNRIFDMLDAISESRSDDVYLMLDELMQLKEEPVKIVALISRQVILLLKASALIEDGKEHEIASALKLHPFIAKKYAMNARAVSPKVHGERLRRCLEADESIKSGAVAPKSALEILIADMLA